MSREIRKLSTCKLYYDRSVKTARLAHEHRPDIVMFDKTIKEAYVKDVALPTVTTSTAPLLRNSEIHTFNRDKATERDLYSAISATQNRDFST